MLIQSDDPNPSLPEDVEWETFEEIEGYVTDSSSSNFKSVVPAVLWNYVFAPTSIDVATLSYHRKSVLADYQRVEAFYEGIETELVEQSHLSTEGGNYNSLVELLADIDRRCFPVSLTPPDQGRTPCQYELLSDQITAIEQGISDEQEFVEISERLLSAPEAAFLREDERSDLSRVRTVLAHSVDEGIRRKNELENTRREIIETVEEQVDEWQAEFEWLKEQAGPYLESEMVNDIGEVVEDVHEFETTLDSFRDKQPLERVSHPLVTQFNELEQHVSSLLKDLEQCQMKIAEAELEQVLASASESLPDIEQKITVAKEQGEPFNSPDTLLQEIDVVREEIKSFRKTPHASVVPENRLDEVVQYQKRLNEYETFIEEKTWFDSEIQACADVLRQLENDAEPYVEFDRYLTEPRRTELTEQIQLLQTDLAVLREEANLSVLGTADGHQLEEYESKVRTIKAHLTDYNSRFVPQQRESCIELFSDIGPDALVLTEEQQRAVIRNGIYNQVIAAAGTGKTLALTTRVAYLVIAQDVDPSRVLVVTYTREARRELRERLADHFGITDVEIRTVNSFGHNIIQNAQEGYVDLVDEDDQENLIDREIRNARNGDASEFLEHYYEFLVHFDDVYHAETDFETKQAYVEARRDANYVTLKGTEVKSRAEKLIADFLYTHNVKYRYEDRATWAETASEKAGYQPDFYLPAYDVYIEHWGVDESGSIAPWFSWSSEKYREKIRWARQQFSDSEYGLINTYEFEHEANRLKNALHHRLTHQGVELNRMDFEELVETAFDYEYREGWIKTQFQRFIENAKLFNVTQDDIKTKLSPQNPRQYHFGQCGIHLLQRYERYLTQNGLIDFIDQIHDAVELIQNNPTKYKTQYDHVLVDEFQDIGAGKLELIQELTGRDAARLFAVGDDWQSIFSFQGAAIENFTDFDRHFGDPVRTDLTANFRSPPSVINAGNDLITQNPDQLDKRVHATMDFDAAPHVHTLRGYKDSFYDYIRRVRRYTTALVRDYIAAGAAPSEIMILCRYDGARPFLDEIKKKLRSQEIPYVGKEESDQYRGPDGSAEDGVSVYAVHQAKGREAKHVILVDVTEGPYGFPPDDRESELLQPVQPFGGGGIEEERRICYVAITRAKQSLDLLTRANHESRFLGEIAAYTEEVDTGQVEPLEDVGERMTIEVKVEELSNPWRKQHQRGILVDRYGGAARFISWMSDIPPTLELNEWYHLSNVLVDEYNGQKELVISDEESVTHLPNGPREPETAELPGKE